LHVPVVAQRRLLGIVDVLLLIQQLVCSALVLRSFRARFFAVRSVDSPLCVEYGLRYTLCCGLAAWLPVLQGKDRESMLAFWGSAMELADDSRSNAGSDGGASSVGSSTLRAPSALSRRTDASRAAKGADAKRKAKAEAVPAAEVKPSRPVSKLRPSKAITVAEGASVQEACRLMAGKRADAALVVAANGVLCGIITDTDVSRRVLGKGLDPGSTTVGSVMTRNPSCVQASDGAMDALCMMVEGRFRHLPVTDGAGDIVGVLDIAKCLYDAISRLENAETQLQSSQEDMVGAVLAAAGGLDLGALQALLAPLREKSSPTLGRVLLDTPGSASAVVDSAGTVSDACDVMLAQHVSAVMVVEEGVPVGILTTKDVLSRVVAKGVAAEGACVSSVMTPNPDTAPPETTILDALHIMHRKLFVLV